MQDVKTEERAVVGTRRERLRQAAEARHAQRRRRLLAVATAGLALCLGVSVTSLAAWQQTGNLSGTDGSGNAIGSTLLSIELSTDGGTTWTQVSAGQNGQLSFGTNARLLSPGDTVYASVLLRAGIGSRGATVVMNGGTVGSDALLGALSYGSRSGVTSANCTAAGYSSAGSTLVAAGSALSAGSGATSFSVPAATSSAAGTPVGVCIALGLPVGALGSVGGLTASPVWHLVATSV